MEIGAAHGHFPGFDGNWTWFWPLMILVKVAFWGLVIWLILRFARPWLRARQPKGPERILAERFADGAIGEQEYRERLQVIRSAEERR